MMHVVVVAPFYGANMAHALRCFLALDGVKVGVISHEPAERMPADIRAKVAGHFRVDNALDAGQLTVATRAFHKDWGRVDRLEGYLEQLQVPVAVARDALGIDGLGAAAARRFRDKNLMKETLRAAGLPVARQARITGADDVLRFVREVGLPIVLKPLDGAGARSTMRVTSESELGTALNMLMPSPANPCQAEEFVQAKEHSCETVFIDGKPVWSSSSFYLPGPLRVMENPWEQYCVLLPREVALPHVKRFLPINHASLRALGLVNGISHMEWFLRSNGEALVNEVGARPAGANITTLNSVAHDTDLWQHWARLQVHRTWDVPERAYAAGCAFVRGQGRGRRITAVHHVDELNKELGSMVVQAKLPKVGQPHSTHYEGDGFVIVRHPDTDTVVRALRRIVTTLRVELG